MGLGTCYIWGREKQIIFVPWKLWWVSGEDNELGLVHSEFEVTVRDIGWDTSFLRKM